MAELKFKPVRHSHKEFLRRQQPVRALSKPMTPLRWVQVANQMLKARSRAGLTQDAVAERIGTTKSAVSRLESAGKHAPSLATLKRYAPSCWLRASKFVRKTA